MVLTFSRTALLGFVVLLVACAFRRATRRFALFGFALATLAMAVTWSFWVPRAAITSVNEVRSLAERTDAFRSAGVLLLEHPFIGVGLHAMPRALVERASRDPANVGPVDPYTAQPAHNIPLLAVAEVGVVGVLVLVLVLIALFRDRSSLVIGHWSLVIPLLPSLLFDHHLWSLPVGLALLFVLAVAMTVPRQDGH